LEAPATVDINSTLDYLGLADGSESLPPASMTELRTQAQKAIAQSGPASRNRASTVSNFARPYRQSVTDTGPYSRDHTAYGSEHPQSQEEELAQAIEVLGMYDSSYLSHPQLANLYSSFRDPSRPRATTIGSLDNPVRRGGMRGHGYLSSIPQSPVQANMGHSQGVYGSSYGYTHNLRSRSDRDLTRSRDSSVSRGPRLSISSHTSRTGTPDFDKMSSTPQMPTRSLWIGNLDVSATSDALFQVFSPYGGIESVRLLPEKVSQSRRTDP
jgi:protein JSN1